MDIDKFINDNDWSHDVDDVKPFQYLINWNAKSRFEFDEFVELIDQSETKTIQYKDYEYSAIRSKGRLKHTILKRIKHV